MSLLKSLLTNIFIETRFKSVSPNSRCFFLAGFTDNQLEAIEARTVDSITRMNRFARVIDTENLTPKEIFDVINKEYSYSLEHTYRKMMHTFHDSDTVFILKNLSKAKTDQPKGEIIRQLVHILDTTYKQHFDAKSDLIIIDKASFLEDNWELISDHIIYNLPSHFESCNDCLIDYAMHYQN